MSGSENLSSSIVKKNAQAAFHTLACDVLGCDLPIVSAGMGGVARSELVTAVSEAGGYGFLGMVREAPEFIRHQINEVRAGTKKAFGVNLIPAATPSALLQKELKICIDEKVHSVCLFWDVDPDIIRTLRTNGILVVCQVGTLDDAEQALDAGAQMLIAQGVEAGGHVRGRDPLQNFLKAVIAISGDIPVLASGGIASGGAFIDALNQGASGVVLGTAYLATDESFAHAYHKMRIVDGTAADCILTDKFHINWPKGAMVRVLRNSVIEGKHGDPFMTTRQIIGEENGRTIYRFSTDSPLRATTGDLESMALYAGLGTDIIKSIVSVERRTLDLLSEALVSGAETIENFGHAVSKTENASPVCYAREANNSYMGFMSPEDVADFLNTILAAKRAITRVVARLIIETSDVAIRSKMKMQYANEIFFCGFLVKEITSLGGTPILGNEESSGKIVMLGNEARLAFLTSQQAWISKKISENLAKIRDDRLHTRLARMLKSASE